MIDKIKNKKLIEAVEAKGEGIVIPMLNSKDLQVKASAVVPPTYIDAIECHQRWSDRFNKQCAEVVEQHKDVLDFEDKDRIEGNKPVVAEKPIRVEDQKLTESLEEIYAYKELQNGDEIIEPTYCPDCGVKFVRDEEGDAICPKCNKTPYQLANERRKNESLNENDIKYTATGRKKLVSDETMSLAVEAARTVDPNAKRDYDDDFIYGDDGHGGSTWVILLNGDGKAYSTWGRNAVLTSKVEKAVNDAADAYWADFDKRWEENNKHLTAKGIKESALNEALYGMNEIKQFVKMASQLGLKTMGDFKDFMDREGQGKDVITALYDYLHDEIGDLNFQAKDESLKEDKVTGKPEDADEKIQFGDEIVYNGKHLFVINANFMDSDRYLWVTDKREDRYNRWAPGKLLAKDQVDKVIRQPDEDGQGDKVNKSIDFTNAADVRHRLDRYSGRTLTVTFKGSYAWEHISELLDEYSNGDEEEADLALDKLEAIYGSEYKLLKALEVDEISEITAMGKDVIVTIKVDKDDLYHDYSDLINNPSVNKGTVKILELDESKNESLKESDDSQFDKAVEAMKAYWNYQMSLEQLHNTLLKIYNNDAEKAFKVFAEYGDAARRSKDECLNCDPKEECLTEDTVKQADGKWVNRGKEGTHGEFDTKKEADAQRKAMFANGHKENLTEAAGEPSEETEIMPEAKVKIALEKFKPWGNAVSPYNQIVEVGKLEDLEKIVEQMYPDGIEDAELNDLLTDVEWLSAVLGMKFKVEG